MRLWFPINIGSSETHGESPQPYQIYTSKKGVRLMDKKTEDWRRCEQDGASPSQGTRRILMELIKGDIHEQIQ